jgi:hypothetical protein
MELEVKSLAGMNESWMKHDPFEGRSFDTPFVGWGGVGGWVGWECSVKKYCLYDTNIKQYMLDIYITRKQFQNHIFSSE